jgi:hypothetical protein
MMRHLDQKVNFHALIMRHRRSVIFFSGALIRSDTVVTIMHLTTYEVIGHITSLILAISHTLTPIKNTSEQWTKSPRM